MIKQENSILFNDNSAFIDIPYNNCWCICMGSMESTFLSVGASDKPLTATHSSEQKENNKPSKQLVEQAKQLDCLTSPKDQDDPEYDIDKDMRRDELLLANDYSSLKSELHRLGL